MGVLCAVWNGMGEVGSHLRHAPDSSGSKAVRGAAFKPFATYCVDHESLETFVAFEPSSRRRPSFFASRVAF